MSHYPDPERYPVGSPEREAEQQRKNDLMRLAVERLSTTNPPASRAREEQRELAALRAQRRERIATAAMQGLLSHYGIDISSKELVFHAAHFADALIAELDRKGEEG